MSDTFTKTLLYRNETTNTEFWAYDDNPKDDNADIDELNLFDLLDEDEEE